jgi:hypothetical protein
LIPVIELRQRVRGRKPGVSRATEQSDLEHAARSLIKQLAEVGFLRYTVGKRSVAARSH